MIDQRKMTFNFGLEFLCQVRCIRSEPRFFRLFTKLIFPFVDNLKNMLAFGVKLLLVFILVDRIFEVYLSKFVESLFVFRDHSVEVLFVFSHAKILQEVRTKINP